MTISSDVGGGLRSHPVVQVLGAVRVVGDDGEEVGLGGRLPRTVVAVLAAEPGTTFDTYSLVDALWGDRPPANAEASLRNHLSQVRRALRSASGLDQPLVRSSTGYRLAPGLGPSDAQVAERAFHDCAEHAARSPAEAIERLAAVESLWRGEPYDGTVDPPRLVPDRQRLIELFHAVRELRFALLIRAGRASECVHGLEADLLAHPVRERTAELLMRALYAGGRQRDALEVFGRTRKHLVEDVGVEPGPALRAVEEAVLHHRLDEVEPATGDRPAAGIGPIVLEAGAMPAARRIIGRDDLVRDLQRRFEAAAPGTHLFALVGEPGAGKTALAVDLLRRTEAADGSSLYLRHGRDDQRLPLQPWADLVHLVRRQHPASLEEELPAGVRAGLAALSPAVLGAPTVEGDVRAVNAAVAELIAAIGRERPAVVVLDDVHWSDPASLDLLWFLHKHPTTSSTAVVVTARREELVGPAADLFDELELDGRLVELPALSSEASKLLAIDVNAGLGPEDLDAIAHLARGNPLMVTQLARAERLSGFTAELLTLRPDVRAARLLRERLEGLAVDEIGLLSAAATAGLEFDLDTLVDLTERPPMEVLAVLQEARDRRIVEEIADAPDRFGFVHALYWAVLRDRPTGALRRRWHGRLARRRARERSVIAAAYHALEGLPEISDPLLSSIAVDAADELRRRGARVEQLDLTERLLGTGRLSGPAASIVRLHQARARCILGDRDGSRAAYLEVFRAEVEAKRWELAGRVAVEIDDYGRSMSELGPRYQLLQDAHDAMGGSRGLTDDTSIAVAAALVTEGNLYGRAASERDTSTLESLAHRNLEAARLSGDRPSVAAALFAAKVSLEWRGEEEARRAEEELAAELLVAAEQTGELHLQRNALIGLTRLSVQAGDVDGAERWLVRAEELGRRTQVPSIVWFSRLARATMLRLQGDLDGADRELDAMHAYGASMDQPDNDSGWAAGHYFTAYHRPEPDALAVLRPVVEAAASGSPVVNPVWQLAAGLTQAADGDHVAARRTFDDAVAGLDDAPRNVFWPSHLCLAAHLGWWVGADADQLEGLLGHLIHWRGSVVVTGSMIGVPGPVDRYLAMLDDALGRHESAERRRVDAEEVARRLGSLTTVEQLRRDRSAAHGLASAG